MKGFLIAGLIALLTVAAVESLSCVQCNSLTDTCVNSSATECPADANASCTTFLTNFSLAGNISLYQDKACSAENCSEGAVEAFTVHVTDEESFHFASQCCLGRECEDTNGTVAPPQEDVSGNIECLACYGPNETSCNETARKCYKEERCVSLITKLVLKGCSNISNATCQFLSTENRRVGGVLFQKFECVSNLSISSTPVPTLSTTTDTGCKAAFTPLALVSFLLLGLVL
uniref:LY6/PLAUR domain containing 8 n=1 Tax=Catagonus wagneri TaxID=51154 RepID=A0A8C3YFM8_9CETA